MSAFTARKPCQVCGEPRSREVLGVRLHQPLFESILEAFCSEECLEVRCVQLGLDGWQLTRETPSRRVFARPGPFALGFDPGLPDNSPPMFILGGRHWQG